MALVVETGQGLANAESYLSVENATTYHSIYGSTGWATLTPSQQEAALRRATQYLDARYAWQGEKTYPATQALQWPRTNLPADSYYLSLWPPVRLQQACAELALRSHTESLYTDQVDAQVTSKTVGPISVTYAPGANGGQRRFALIDDLLKPLVRGGSRMSVRIERAA